MSSFFDDPREPLDPPTMEEFVERAGPPTLSFTLDQGDISVPLGLLACCRVVHQSHCEHHAALSLIGCFFRLGGLDDEGVTRTPAKLAFEGDVLARPRDLSAAVQAVALQAQATAEALDFQVVSMQFDIWVLNMELAAMWKYFEAGAQDALEQYDTAGTPVIEGLPVVVLSPEEPLAVARVQANPHFRPVRSYASRVLVLPHEIGHDERARYVTNPVWGEPDEVPAAVDAIIADPQEATA
jgi:hypothetical protein